MRKRILYGGLTLALLGLAWIAAKPNPVWATQSTRLTIYAYVDINSDKMMSDGEGIDRIPIYVEVEGQRQAKIAENGKITFSLPYAIIQAIKVEIPYLAVAEEVQPKDEQAVVSFRIQAPEFPVYLP
ncbi:MAG: hypothetical protein HN413_13345 [Chloroflexi bacterium]|jgi:hypothetical protein|nr:hypothetical protein [Chloroflexota bacterium]